MNFHSPPTVSFVQPCPTDAVIVIFLDYCFTDIHLTGTAAFQRLVITLLVLASGLRLLAPLHAGTLVMLPFPDLGQDASLGAAALETLQRAVDGFIFLHMDLRHLYFPSLRGIRLFPGYFKGHVIWLQHRYYTDLAETCQEKFQNLCFL